MHEFITIKFTFEVKNEEQVSFMDVLITWNSIRLEFGIFKKIPEFAGMFLTTHTIINNIISKNGQFEFFISASFKFPAFKKLKKKRQLFKCCY